MIATSPSHDELHEAPKSILTFQLNGSNFQPQADPVRRVYPFIGPKWVEQYSLLHSQIMNGSMSLSESRLLILRPHVRGGLGNRIRAMTGALAFAVLTRRALVLDLGVHAGRGNETEAGLLLPASFDWRARDPAQPGRGWPHGVEPRPGPGLRVVQNNAEAWARGAGPEDLWPDTRILVFDSQVSSRPPLNRNSNRLLEPRLPSVEPRFVLGFISKRAPPGVARGRGFRSCRRW